MSVLTDPKTWQWSADVLAFASQNRAEECLGPLLEATRQVFPTAHGLRVLLEEDPEIRDDRHIVFEVRMPRQDVPNFVQAQHRWVDELYRVCPAPLVWVFRLYLSLV
jgi:hypothetical protein